MFDFGAYIHGEEFETLEIEFKETVSHKNYETWAKEVAAFANTCNGKIFFGVEDGTSEPKGLSKSTIQAEVLYINEIVDKKISPRVFYEFKRLKIGEDRYILEMSVAKNEQTPVWLTRSDEQDVIYIRRDGQSVIAHGNQIEELVLGSKRKAYDAEFTDERYDPARFSLLESLFNEKKSVHEPLTVKKLQGIGAVSLDGRVSRGLALFADNCKQANCNVTCRIWPGLSKGSSTMIDRKEFRGPIPSLLEFMKNYIRLYTKQGLVKLSEGGRASIVSYPDRAIDEALINAIAHRDYFIDGGQIDIDIFKDRIQITSPGSFLLPGNAQDYAMRNIPSRRRNEVVCAIFEICDLMEKSGSGFEKIADCYAGFDGRFAPSVYSDPAQFSITLRDLTYESESSDANAEKADIHFEFKPPRSGNREYDRRILEFCMESPKSRQEIQDFLELYDRKNFIYSILNPLVDAELLLLTQQSRNAPNQKYFTNKERLRFI